MQVNGIDITVAPHDQAVALLTGIRGEISLVVSRDNSSGACAPILSPAAAATTGMTSSNHDIGQQIGSDASFTAVPVMPAADFVTMSSSVDDEYDRRLQQQPEVTSPQNADEPPIKRHHFGQIAASAPATNDELQCAATARSADGTDVAVAAQNPVTSPSQRDVVVDGGGVTADRQTSGPEIDSRASSSNVASEQRLLIAEDLQLIGDEQTFAEPGTIAAAASCDISIEMRDCQELLRTSRQVIFSLGDGDEGDKKGLTSFKLAEAEFKMQAALAAAGAGYEFGLSPPGCSDVDSTATDVHQMIQNELLQTLRLL
jgi:hypothetical protein